MLCKGLVRKTLQHVLRRSEYLPPRLFAGAALFGVGWALAGFCPGPAIVGVGSGMVEALLFLPGMLVGMGLFGAWDGRAARRTADSDKGAVE